MPVVPATNCWKNILVKYYYVKYLPFYSLPYWQFLGADFGAVWAVTDFCRQCLSWFCGWHPSVLLGRARGPLREIVSTRRSSFNHRVLLQEKQKNSYWSNHTGHWIVAGKSPRCCVRLFTGTSQGSEPADKVSWPHSFHPGIVPLPWLVAGGGGSEMPPHGYCWPDDRSVQCLLRKAGNSFRSGSRRCWWGR